MWNDSLQDRVVLYFDFWHPDLSSEEKRALQIWEEERKRADAAASLELQEGLEHLLSRFK